MTQLQKKNAPGKNAPVQFTGYDSLFYHFGCSSLNRSNILQYITLLKNDHCHLSDMWIHPQSSSMDPVRLKRKEDISKALTFMQSPLAYPDPEGYKDFLTVLVCNLLEEGKALFKDQDWQQAVKEFSEGLNVSQYAASEDICIPEALLESLFVNRAAAYYSMGEYDQGVEDCDKALSVCKESCQALYRKALCLKELGKYKEAYSCTTDCLLINRLDNQVNELAQELAVHLGLKIRKPYISAKEDGRIKVTNGKTTQESIKVCTDHMGNGAGPLAGITPGNFSSHDQTPPTVQGFFQLGVPSAPELTDDCELIGEDLDSLLDSFPNEPEPTETLVQAFSAPGLAFPHEHTTPSVLPAPTPQLPPAFFSSASSQLNCLDSFIQSGSMASTLDTLDDVSASSALDNPSKISYRTAAPNVGLTTMIQDSQGDLDSLDDLLTTNVVQEVSKAELDTKQSLTEAVAVSPGLSGLSGISGLYTVDGLLDALDMFPSADCASVGTGVDSLSDFILNGITDCPSAVSLKTESKERNKPSALSTTHEFKQACSACFPRKGKGIYTFVHKPDLVHSCEGDILLCRRINGPSEWTRVRSIPLWTSFTGPFVLCRELLKSGDLGLCKYGENCTFAFNQLEIDVWTEERRGRFNRKLLFENPAVKQDPVKEILRLLQEHKGMFIFLCGACYDNKPTMISNRSRDDNTICSNMDARHSFDANKCLAFMIRSMTVRYRKVRPLHILCQLDLCRHNIRYGCLKKDECIFAHSDIELKTWRLQRETGITPEEIVKVSTNYYEKQEKDSSKQKNLRQPPAGGGGGKTKGGGPRESLNMRMKFVCAQCWRDGLTSEPDKALRYCSAKAKHVWTKDKRVLLVKSLERSKWVMVRPLPHAKKFPLHYDICCQILDKGRCNYSGNCTFAHSAEEKTMWTYMKNNELVDMQQVYEMWLALSTQNRQNDESMFTQSIPEEKCIVMPTDYAEPMDGFHCRLCGKHSNSERQWQQHISTEKHKDRVFSCEEEDKALTWNYRFPAKCFELCPKLVGDCPDGMSCDYAHSPEELQEWIERRDLFRHKLAKAREDMLIMPDESDFGKYSFLLQD